MGDIITAARSPSEEHVAFTLGQLSDLRPGEEHHHLLSPKVSETSQKISSLIISIYIMYIRSVYLQKVSYTT